MVKQYIRTCKNCSNTWYSLVSRESQLTSKRAGYKADVCCSTCDIFDFGKRAKQQANRDAVDSELANLKRCPKCGSSSYNEVVAKF